MKRYLSVLALDARCTVYKMLGILVMMAIAQLAFFYRVLQNTINQWQEIGANWRENGLLVTFEQAIEGSYINIFFVITLVGIMLVLIWSCSEHGKSRSKQLLWRLRIERRRLFVVWSIYRFFCILIVFAWQILLVMAMDELYQYMIAQGLAPQSLFLAFYRDDFLHGLLPISDIMGCILLLCFVVLWSMSIAYVGYMGFTEHRTACSVALVPDVYTIYIVSMGVPVGLNFWVEALFAFIAVIACICMMISVTGSLGKDYEG